MTKAVAIEFSDANIRVNTMHRGVVEITILDASSPVFKHLKNMMPLGRAAQPEEMAAVVLFIASDDACFIRGIVLAVDGGFKELYLR